MLGSLVGDKSCGSGQDIDIVGWCGSILVEWWNFGWKWLFNIYIVDRYIYHITMGIYFLYYAFGYILGICRSMGTSCTFLLNIYYFCWPKKKVRKLIYIYTITIPSPVTQTLYWWIVFFTYYDLMKLDLTLFSFLTLLWPLI